MHLPKYISKLEHILYRVILFQLLHLKRNRNRGRVVVRLHTGDPCIYGAIQEQIDFFEAHDISYHITPGISSFLAAAAELRSQFTIPGRCQTWKWTLRR